MELNIDKMRILVEVKGNGAERPERYEINVSIADQCMF